MFYIVESFLLAEVSSREIVSEELLVFAKGAGENLHMEKFSSSLYNVKHGISTKLTKVGVYNLQSTNFPTQKYHLQSTCLCPLRSTSYNENYGRIYNLQFDLTTIIITTITPIITPIIIITTIITTT